MLSVLGDDRLKATVLAYKAADRDLRRDINAATRDKVGPVWSSAVNALAVSALDKRILATGARIKAGNPPAALAATSTRALSGGLVPTTDWPMFEFGTTDRNKMTTYTAHSPKGRSYVVHSRHTRRQLPGRDARGRVVFKAFKDIAPKAVTLWCKIVVSSYRSAVD